MPEDIDQDKSKVKVSVAELPQDINTNNSKVKASVGEIAEDIAQTKQGQGTCRCF